MCMAKIDNYIYGCITINRKDYKKDIYITANNAVVTRKRTLNRNTLEVSPAEIKFLLKAEPDVIVIGTGKIGWLKVPKEIPKLCKKANVKLEIFTTKKAGNRFNWYFGKNRVAGLFHITD